MKRNVCSKNLLSIESDLDSINASSYLEGYTLSKKALERCKMILEGKLSPEDAIKQVLSASFVD
jgi:hypothetical protein